MNCAQILRAIGQDLERLEIDTFRLVCGDYSFIIQELAKGAEKQPGEGHEHRGVRSSLREFHYTFEDIKRLDERGRGNRRDAEGLPEPDSLTNMLRAAATYVDLKDGRLLEITKSDDKGLTVRYETAGGKIHTELLEASELYALFVRVYLQRADRSRRSESQP